MTPAEVELIVRAVEERLVPAIEERLEPRFLALDRKIDDLIEGLEKKVDDLTDLVQATATGHAKRFDAIEKRLDGKPPLELV